MNDLLLPIVKGVGSERSYEMLALSLQTLGGSGFLQDYPIEQYIRDTKIDTLYEGTTGIQGQDFFFRKIVRDSAECLNRLFARDRAGRRPEAVQVGARRRARDGRHHARLARGRRRDSPRDLQGRARTRTRLLMSVGDLVIGWLLRAAARSSAEGARLAAWSKFFGDTVLPELAHAPPDPGAHRQRAHGGRVLMKPSAGEGARGGGGAVRGAGLRRHRRCSRSWRPRRGDQRRAVPLLRGQGGPALRDVQLALHASRPAGPGRILAQRQRPGADAARDHRRLW